MSPPSYHLSCVPRLWLIAGTTCANQVAMVTNTIFAILGVRLVGLTPAQDAALFAAISGVAHAVNSCVCTA